MKPLLDVHTHTVASGHGYSTIQEMAQAAADKGLQVLGITEHPQHPHLRTALFQEYVRCTPPDVRHPAADGREVNILDTEGRLDLNDEYLDRLDIGIAGIHIVCWQGGTREENTRGMINVIRNPKIHIISHRATALANSISSPWYWPPRSRTRCWR